MGRTERARGRPGGLFRTLNRMQLTGSLGAATGAELARDAQWKRSGVPGRLETVADLPAPLVEAMDQQETHAYERQLVYNGRKRSMVGLVRDMYEILDSVAQEKKNLRRILHELVQRLLDPNGAYSAGDDAAGDSIDATPPAIAAEREKFLQVGGAECLLRVIHTLRQGETGSSGAGKPGARGVTLVMDGERRQRQSVGHRNDIRALWEKPTPSGINLTKSSGSDSTSRKGILNDAMVTCLCRSPGTMTDTYACAVCALCSPIGNPAGAVLLLGEPRVPAVRQGRTDCVFIPAHGRRQVL